MRRPNPAKMDVTDLIASLERAIAEICIQEVPLLLGDLERLKASGWARLNGVQATRSPLSRRRPEWGGENPPTFICLPPPPSICEGGLMKNSLKQHMAFPWCAGRSHLKPDLI
jgi:hypothetical protein